MSNRPHRASPFRARQAAERRGRFSEGVAAAALMLRGYRILERRYRTRMGEIDLIVRRGGTVAFVEVKRRARLDSGMEAVTVRSQARIRRAANLFIQLNSRLSGLSLRFDVLVITTWGWPRHIVDAWRD